MLCRLTFQSYIRKWLISGLLTYYTLEASSHIALMGLSDEIFSNIHDLLDDIQTAIYDLPYVLLQGKPFCITADLIDTCSLERTPWAIIQIVLSDRLG